MLKNLPEKFPDKIAGIPVIRLEYDHMPEFRHRSYYPQLNAGFEGSEKL